MVRSNILVDKYINCDWERELKIVVDDRPLVCASVECLPFKDNSFNFVYASHVLEHITKLEEAISEITRVGKAGLIIVPNEIYERAWDKSTHRWMINRNNGKLIFKSKCVCTKLMECETLDKWRKLFWKIYAKNRSLLDIHFFWKNDILYEMRKCVRCCEENNNIQNHSEPIVKQLSIKSRLKQKILIRLSKIIRLIYT
jgi:ubiquinone/menaquinone biosynthesis C-methylase UbiE